MRMISTCAIDSSLRVQKSIDLIDSLKPFCLQLLRSIISLERSQLLQNQISKSNCSKYVPINCRTYFEQLDSDLYFKLQFIKTVHVECVMVSHEQCGPNFIRSTFFCCRVRVIANVSKATTANSFLELFFPREVISRLASPDTTSFRGFYGAHSSCHKSILNDPN